MSKNNKIQPVNFDSMKCIWMSSKTINYKLCDKDFDCDNCAFDKIMRNIDPEKNVVASNVDVNFQQGIIRKKTDILKSIKYSKEYHYLNNSVVLKKLFGKTYYFGLDSAAYLFLDNVTAYEYLNNGPAIKKNEAFLKISGDWGEMKVISPIDFFVVDKLNHKIEDQKENNWFCLIDAEDDVIKSSEFAEKEYECILEHMILKLYEFDNKFSDLGTRMNDGGTEVKFIYQAIGIQKYKDLIKSIFSNEC